MDTSAALMAVAGGALALVGVLSLSALRQGVDLEIEMKAPWLKLLIRIRSGRKR